MDNSISSSILDQYGIQNTSANNAGSRSELGQDEFMELMLTQLRNQDPFKPKENGEFIAEMAQFSTVAGIDEMQESLQTLASSFANYQTLQSATLVGRSVMVPGSSFSLTEGATIEGAYTTQSTGPATAGFYNNAGELVHEIDLGIVSAGTHEFQWDGLLEDGSSAPLTDYTVNVTYGSGEYAAAAEIMMRKEISSVNFSTTNGETILNTEDGMTLKLSQISQIQ